MCHTVNALTLSYPKVAEASKGHRANTQDGIKFISGNFQICQRPLLLFCYNVVKPLKLWFSLYSNMHQDLHQRHH